MSGRARRCWRRWGGRPRHLRGGHADQTDKCQAERLLVGRRLYTRDGVSARGLRPRRRRRWSISSRVSAQPRWCSAPARARHDHERCGFTDRAGVAVAAKPGLLDAGSGSVRDADGARAAMVDVAGGDLCSLLDWCGSAGLRLARLSQIRDAADLRAAMCFWARRVGTLWSDASWGRVHANPRRCSCSSRRRCFISSARRGDVFAALSPAPC